MKKTCKYIRIIVIILMCFQLLGVFTSISFAQEEIDIVDTAIASYQDDGNSHITGPYYSTLKILI
ncbi:MAG: hypothetical protein IKA84_04210 [Clostridia bacterium]|nr:hypothetical protein [Clostridia bacterium]